MSKKVGLPPAGSGAKVAPGPHVALLEADGDAFQAAVREVYQRCVVSQHPEPWFVAAKGMKTPSGVRPELN